MTGPGRRPGERRRWLLRIQKTDSRHILKVKQTKLPTAQTCEVRERRVKAVHWPVPRPGATLAFSMLCPVLLPLWLPKPLTPLLGGSPRVQAWPAAGVLHRCPGPGDKAGVSRLKDVVSVLGTEAVTSDTGDGTSVGLSMSPAKTQPGSDGASGLP